MRNNGDGVNPNARAEGFESDFADRRKGTEILDFGAAAYGQSYPQRCPTSKDAQSSTPTSPLGEAMSISAVAKMLGCSPWTVRNRYLPQGLPHMRAAANGKLVFFSTQVIRWIVEKQQKGGRK